MSSYYPHENNAQLKPVSFSEDKKCKNFTSGGLESPQKTATFLEAKGGGIKPLIIITPIYDSLHVWPPEQAAEILREAGFHILLVSWPKHVFEWEAIYGADSRESLRKEFFAGRERVRNYFEDLRYWISKYENDTRVAAGGVGIVGFSFGAMMASALMAEDKRVKAGALVMGGARPAEALAFYNAGDAIILKEETAPRLGLDRSGLFDLLYEELGELDPIFCAPFVDSSKILFINASADDFFSPSSIDDFYEALGKPERLEIHSISHQFAFLAMTFLGGFSINKTMIDFFSRKFL